MSDFLRVGLQKVHDQGFTAGAVLDCGKRCKDHIGDGRTVPQAVGDTPCTVYLAFDIRIMCTVRAQSAERFWTTEVGMPAVKLHISVRLNAQHVHFCFPGPGDLVRDSIVALVRKVLIP